MDALPNTHHSPELSQLLELLAAQVSHWLGVGGIVFSIQFSNKPRLRLWLEFGMSHFAVLPLTGRSLHRC